MRENHQRRGGHEQSAGAGGEEVDGPGWRQCRKCGREHDGEHIGINIRWVGLSVAKAVLKAYNRAAKSTLEKSE